MRAKQAFTEESAWRICARVDEVGGVCPSVKIGIEAHVNCSTTLATRTAAPSDVKAVTPSLIILDRE